MQGRLRGLLARCRAQVNMAVSYCTCHWQSVLCVLCDERHVVQALLPFCTDASLRVADRLHRVPAVVWWRLCLRAPTGINSRYLYLWL